MLEALREGLSWPYLKVRVGGRGGGGRTSPCAQIATNAYDLRVNHNVIRRCLLSPYGMIVEDDDHGDHDGDDKAFGRVS